MLSNFEIIAARDGLSVAKNKLGAHTGGIEVWAPLERVEMDEWQIDLMAILSTTGLDFTDERFRDLEVGRYWICVAMDAASRSILGIKLSRSPCAEDAKAVLWMAMRDKSQISKQLGCKKTWKQHGHVHHVIVDNGAAFVDAEFKACLSDLSIEYDVLPAGVPKLRGGIERLFLTLAKMLMPYLTGRTFSNPQERGEYPSEKYAVHTAESIIEILVRFVVDAYHLRSHRGLEHATPNDEWDRLCDKFGWSPPRDRHVLRHALGISYKRRSGRHGVLVCGVNFHSRELERHFKQHGAQDIDLRIDPEDFGHVSAWLGDAWCTLHAMVRGLDGMAFATWEGLISELRQKNRTAASLNQEIIERAIERVKEIDEQQRSSRLLGPITISADDIRRADRETFWGLNLGSHSPSNVACGEGAEIDLLSDEIGETQSDPEEEQRAPQDNNDAAEYWRFSDDDE